MTTLEIGLRLIRDHEGGEFTDNPIDRGGPTRWGISLRFLRTLNPKATRADIVEMKWDRAAHIFAGEFWKKYGYDLLPACVAVKVFDLAVILGPSQIALCLQRACRAGGCAVEEDGVLGGNTRAACFRIAPEILLAAFRSEVAGVFRLIVARDPTQKRFLDGWLSRAYDQPVTLEKSIRVTDRVVIDRDALG